MGSLSEVGFGRLVRTIVPGLVIIALLTVYIDAIAWLRVGELPLVGLVRANGLLAASIALPLSTIAGMLSNMVVFIWLNGILVRKHFASNYPDIVELEERIRGAILQRKGLHNSSLMRFDLDYLAMPEIDIDKWRFLQDSYWSYMEFQLNIFASAIFSMPVVALATQQFAAHLEFSTAMQVLFICITMAILLSTAYFCVYGARFNYVRHMRKRLSYISATIGVDL